MIYQNLKCVTLKLVEDYFYFESKISHAKNDENEAHVIAQAGKLAAVTISTNMAGRGTDIRLGGSDEKEKHQVKALGGLYVIGTNKHESLRIDNQLRGRAGRQGDPGSSQFFVSLEDDQFVKYRITDLFPPKLVSPTTFQFMTFGSYDSAFVFTSPLRALNWIELQPINSFRVKPFSDLFALSLFLSAIMASIDEGHTTFVILNSCVGSMYAFPLLALGGVFSSAAPEKFRYLNQDYFQNFSKWNWEAGLSFGNWPFIKCRDCPHPDRAIAKGLYLNLKRKYSPFSLVFRLHHLPLPNIQRPYWNEFETRSHKNDFELLFNPAVKTLVYSNKRFNLNILTGFLTQMRFLSGGSFYPYTEDLLLWGVVETEIQCHINKNFSMNFSFASHYNFENTRFPFYVGVTYAKSHSYKNGLNLKRINVLPFVHFINTNLYAEGHRLFFGNQDEKKYLNRFMVWD